MDTLITIVLTSVISCAVCEVMRLLFDGMRGKSEKGRYRRK